MKLRLKSNPDGFMLLDCIIYITLFFLILGMAFAAFYKTMEHSKRLNRSTRDVARILEAGERWRDDIRQATSPPRIITPDTEPTLIIPQKNGEVAYTFRGGALLRRADTQARWLEFLPDAASSLMQKDARKRLDSWRWEIELKAPREKVYTRPVFTFQSVAPTDKKP